LARTIVGCDVRSPRSVVITISRVVSCGHGM
jgi:hypothetical protein